MDNAKKNGILLIVIGICIPLFALPFVSGFDMSKGFMENFYNTGVQVIKKTPAQTDAPQQTVTSEKASRGMQIRLDRIPYRFFFVPTFILIYIGIVKIDRARQRARQKTQ